MFKHYILTRFNVGLYSGNPYSIRKPDEWMDKRLELFKSTSNSLKSQTCQNFEWLIEVDPNTPKHYISEIENHGTVIYEKAPIYLRRQKKTEWLITSRIDNDDIYHQDFVKEIQSAFSEKAEVIDVRGAKLELSTGKLHYYYRELPNSPFISLIEPFTDELKTVSYRGGHSTLYLKYPHRFIEKKLFFQVIHDSNLLNKV
jgi:hypothetical protein